MRISVPGQKSLKPPSSIAANITRDEKLRGYYLSTTDLKKKGKKIKKKNDFNKARDGKGNIFYMPAK